MSSAPLNLINAEAPAALHLAVSAHLAACMRAQDVKAQFKKPPRQKLPWMKDDADTSAASGDLGDLLTAAAPAPVAAVAEEPNHNFL